MYEAGTTETADPLGGSWLIEALTTELEQEATTLIERIDALGGAVAAIEAGFTQGEIEEAAFRYQREIEDGGRVIVGVNRFQTDLEDAIQLHRVDPAAEERQRVRTARVRADRSVETAAAALAEITRVAQTDANLLPAMRDALRARCTVGEICTVLRDLWGTYDATR